MNIRFKDITIQEISNVSGVFSGVNLQGKWSHRSKTIEGFGSIDGDKNTVADSRSTTYERDTNNT